MSKRTKVVKVSEESEALKKMRGNRELSFQEVADRMGVSKVHVYQMEVGREDINEAYVRKFLVALCYTQGEWLAMLGRETPLMNDLRSKCLTLVEQMDESKLERVFEMLLGMG